MLVRFTALVRHGKTIQHVEVTPQDIALVNRLSNRVLGQNIAKLSPQTRRLLTELNQWVQAECKRLNVEQTEFHFTRRMARNALGWKKTALKKHLARLVEMKYVLPHRGSGRRRKYELLGQSQPFPSHFSQEKRNA